MNFFLAHIHGHFMLMLHIDILGGKQNFLSEIPFYIAVEIAVNP